MPLEAAMGRVLAEPIRAQDAVPPHAVALRDGWAVIAAETVGGSPYTPVMLIEEPRFVTVGAALPAGADAVLPPDAVSTEAGFAEITAPAAPGENVRRAGEDAGAGLVLRAAGERVRAVDEAVASGAGVSVCRVRQARVRVVGEGAASALIARLAEAAGATVERGPCDDEGSASRTDLLAIVVRIRSGNSPVASGRGRRPGARLAAGRGRGVRVGRNRSRARHAGPA